MPSLRELPTVDQLRSVAIDAVRGGGFDRADNHTGAVFDYFFGTSAILWSQQLQYTRDLFRAIYFDDADGSDLTDRVEKIWGIPRIFDSYGTGFATFSRPSAHRGCRDVPRRDARAHRVGVATPWPQRRTTASTAKYAIVPIRATVYGSG